ncbi:MAG: hypothetical protein ACYSUV_21530 [Planctomycetota bacterium]|jgi:hypothetical protein
MTIKDLRSLIRWADEAPDNVAFWKRLWCAAAAYDVKTRINIRAMCVNVGNSLLTSPTDCGKMDP